VVFGVLFAFWTATAVCVAVIVISSAWDARDDGATAAVAPTSTEAPTATPTPEPRPPAVPPSARQVDGGYDSGELPRHLFFNLSCVGDLLIIATTDEQVYAETVCPAFVDPIFIRPFQGDPVRVTIAEGQLDIVTLAGERLTFSVARAWIERR